MGVTVTRTKILVPRRRPDLLSRSRLISTLDDVLDYPFTLISAPAGYGKTSLMIDFAQKANYPVCWYTIDSLDLDPNRFLTHFVHAIKIQFPEFGEATLSLLETQANPLKDVPQFVGSLINEIYQDISEHFVIFLDDFHHVNCDKGICDFISRFGQEMDDNTHLVMASRTLFDFPDLNLMIGRRMVKGIGFDELVFQTQEIKSYYLEILKRDITDEEIETLFNTTEGWITGLVFSVDTDLAHLPGSGKKGRITSSDLFKYLAEQVFEKQTHPVQDFLLRSSLFNEFNTDLCQHVLGNEQSESWAELILTIQQENLFIQQVEDESSWIRYHALFRDFLRSRFHDQNPEAEERILFKLLEHYRSVESWEKAFAITRQLDNPKLMAQVIDHANSSLIHQGRMELLSSWLEILPDEGYESLPKLLIVRGISFTAHGNPQKGLAFINNAINQPAIANKPQLLIRAILCRITTSRLLGLYNEALTDIEYIFDSLLSENVNDTLVAETYREAALANFNLGNYVRSKKQFIRSLDVYSNIGDISNQALVHQDLGLLLMEHGSFNEATIHFNLALKTWEEINNITQLSNILNNIGALSVQTGRYRDSANILQSAITFSEASLNTRMIAFVKASQGDLAKSLSLYTFAYRLYDLANTVAENIQEGYLLSYLALNKATLLRYMGKSHRTLELLQVSHSYIFQRSSRTELGLWNLEMGFHRLAVKEYPSSKESFLLAEDIFKSTGKPVELAKARMGLVLVSHSMAKPRQLRQHIKDWMSSLVPLETNQPLLPELYFQEEIIRDVFKTIPSNPALDKLLTELEIYSKQLPQLQIELFPDQEQDPVPNDKLEILALGMNQVIIEGKKITSPEWIYQKTVRELFFYLLTLPRGASKEQIGLVFWPDSSTSQLTCQFKNALYRLRRSVGRETILYDTETKNYKFNQDRSYSYDVESFLTALTKAEKEPSFPEKIKRYQEAVDLYIHPYSPQVGGVWAEPIRQSLARKCEQALLILAEYELDQNQNQACLNYCQLVLDIEPCQEKAYQLSIHACAKSNDRTKLVRTYRIYKNNLEKYLGIAPSYETTTIYKEYLG